MQHGMVLLDTAHRCPPTRPAHRLQDAKQPRRTQSWARNTFRFNGRSQCGPPRELRPVQKLNRALLPQRHCIREPLYEMKWGSHLVPLTRQSSYEPQARMLRVGSRRAISCKLTCRSRGERTLGTSFLNSKWSCWIGLPTETEGPSLGNKHFTTRFPHTWKTKRCAHHQNLLKCFPFRRTLRSFARSWRSPPLLPHLRDAHGQGVSDRHTERSYPATEQTPREMAEMEILPLGVAATGGGFKGAGPFLEFLDCVLHRLRSNCLRVIVRQSQEGCRPRVVLCGHSTATGPVLRLSVALVESASTELFWSPLTVARRASARSCHSRRLSSTPSSRASRLSWIWANAL